MNLSKMTPSEFLLLKNFIEDECGIAISEENAYLLEIRLSKIIADFGLIGFDDLYVKIAVRKHPEIYEDVINAITTNETFWFRDKLPWNVLEEVLMPSYIDEIRSGNRDKVRIWSAACSTGQEPYSIAMCIDSYLTRYGIKDIQLSHFEIIATDLSHTVLNKAKRARYDGIAATRGLDTVYREKYFKSHGRAWVLNEEIRDSVQFTHLNLKDSFFFLGKFDIIFCRYVNIYFSENLKNDILNRMASRLEPWGVLFLGSSEIFQNYKESFELVEYKGGVYYKSK